MPIRNFFRPEGPVQLPAPGNAWGYGVIPFTRPERASQLVLGGAHQPTTSHILYHLVVIDLTGKLSVVYLRGKVLPFAMRQPENRVV